MARKNIIYGYKFGQINQNRRHKDVWREFTICNTKNSVLKIIFIIIVYFIYL